MELHTFVLTAENRKNYLKVVNVLPRPFPVTYVLGRHQREISQKERANPELTAVEVLPRPSPITYILSSKKHALEQEILLPMRSTCLRQKNVKKNVYLLLKVGLDLDSLSTTLS